MHKVCSHTNFQQLKIEYNIIKPAAVYRLVADILEQMITIKIKIIRTIVIILMISFNVYYFIIVLCLFHFYFNDPSGE